MNPPTRLLALAGLVLKRLWYDRGLTLLALLGVVLAVGLVTSTSIFSYAIERVILMQELAEFSRMTGRPPFSVSIYLHPSTSAPVTLEVAEQAGNHVADTLSSEVGLPPRHLGFEVSSGSMMLQPQEVSALYGNSSYLVSVEAVYKAGIEDYVEMTAGDPLDDIASTEVLDVWMHTRLAEEMGAQIGDRFDMGITVVSTPVAVRIRGFWQALDATDPFWFGDPDTKLRNALLVRRQDYIALVEPIVPSGTRRADWHIILDESKALPDRARSYISGFEKGLTVINKYVPNARLNAPPIESLAEYVHRETTLGTLLLALNTPAFGFLLYFLILTSTTIARRQRHETATMVSRGIGLPGILSLTLIEELGLFAVGYPLGVGFGLLLARLMGYTSSFLTFVPRTPLPVSLLGISVPLTLVALAVSLIARLLPAAQTARQDVMDVERELARPARGPFWYRYYLDLLLLPPVAYLYRSLTSLGSIAFLVQDQPEDILRDPLLILVPALFVLAAALMAMRAFPLVLRVIDAVASLTPWITPHLALRQLSRQSSSYVNPLLVIIISLGLGVYSMSMAASLDQWLADRMYYRVGADVAFVPVPKTADHLGGERPNPVGGSWIPLPHEFSDLPGVFAAARVGRYPARLNLTGRAIRVRFLGIDRASLPSVAWFRHDFSREPLGEMMNHLAETQDSVLVSRGFLRANQLIVGDQVRLRLTVDEQLPWIHTTFTVAGTYDHFPTVYDEDGPTFIGNLDYLSALAGVTLNHHIWIRTQPGANGKSILASVSKTGVDASWEQDVGSLIAEEQASLERVGVFGTLSTGFLAAIITAAVGLLIYTYASLRERLYRFTVLRAIGLTRPQVIGQVILEYAFLLAFGTTAGAFIGTAVSRLFVPLFKVTGEVETLLPSLIPVIARGDVLRLAIGFAGAMVLLEVLVIVRALFHHFETLKGHWWG